MLAGFTVMFLYILVRVLRPGKKELYSELARMPLDDKDEV